MRLYAVLLVGALVPLLATPAVGEVYVQSPPDRAFVLLMRQHTFNAQTWPRTPLLEAAVGETVQFTVLVPPLAEPHTFHLHGHPWFLPSKDRMVDTVLLQPGETLSFSVKAGGIQRASGDWMYHCHFDDHVVGGMWGVFRVYPYATSVSGAAPRFEVRLDREGEPIDGATLRLTLDGQDVPAHVEPQGDGRYRVHAGIDPLAHGVLVVTASHELGESVARVALGGIEAPTPDLADGAPAGGSHH